MWYQCDIEVNQQILLEFIIDHNKNKDAVWNDDQFSIYNVRKYLKKNTKRWDLCVQ